MNTNELLLMEIRTMLYIAVHILNNNDHSIQWDEAKVVKREHYISTRKIKKSLIIRAAPKT